MRQRLFLLFLSAALVSGVAIIASQAADNNSPKIVVVRMLDNRFVPAEVKIRPGDTVQWIAQSDGPSHQVTTDPAQADDPKDVSVPAGVKPFDSGRIRAGTTYTVRFNAPGVYRYACPPHENHGMKGEVIVEQ